MCLFVKGGRITFGNLLGPQPAWLSEDHRTKPCQALRRISACPLLELQSVNAGGPFLSIFNLQPYLRV